MGVSQISVLRKDRKYTVRYLKKHCLDAVMINGKAACPFCSGKPDKQLAYSVEDGCVVFYRQCSTCGDFIRTIYRD